MINFSSIPEERVLFRSAYFFLIYDRYPVSPGHLLIISNKLKKDLFELSPDELKALPDMILKAKEIIDPVHQPDGYNIGMNCGEAAGQTVMHFHCHIIPRYNGDMQNPRGGVRHSVEGRGYY